MKLSKIPKEDLELMGYDEIALLVLQETGKKMKLRDIFAKVVEVLDLPAETIDEQLVDFFEQMSINKKFIMLKNGFWDLQSRHKLDVVFDMDDEDEDEEIAVDDDETDIGDTEPEETEEDIFADIEDESDDPVDDDLSDLVVLDPLEDESNL